jgi:hypothetical protein
LRAKDGKTNQENERKRMRKKLKVKNIFKKII